MHWRQLGARRGQWKTYNTVDVTRPRQSFGSSPRETQRKLSDTGGDVPKDANFAILPQIPPWKDDAVSVRRHAKSCGVVRGSRPPGTL